MNLRVHKLVGNDIDVLPFRANHDASSAADEMCTTESIEPERAEPTRVSEEHKYWFRFNSAEGAFNSRAGIAGELSVPLLINLRFNLCERTIGGPMPLGYANEKAGRWARERKGKSGD